MSSIPPVNPNPSSNIFSISSGQTSFSQLKYLDTIISARGELRKVMREAKIADSLSTQNSYDALSEKAAYSAAQLARQYRSNILLKFVWTQINEVQKLQQQACDAYNQAVSSAMANYQAALDSYNAGQSDANSLAQAITNFNNAVLDATPSYNNATTAYNSAINTINQQIISIPDLQTLPIQDLIPLAQLYYISPTGQWPNGQSTTGTPPNIGELSTLSPPYDYATIKNQYNQFPSNYTSIFNARTNLTNSLPDNILPNSGFGRAVFAFIGSTQAYQRITGTPTDAQKQELLNSIAVFKPIYETNISQYNSAATNYNNVVSHPTSTFFINPQPTAQIVSGQIQPNYFNYNMNNLPDPANFPNIIAIPFPPSSLPQINLAVPYPNPINSTSSPPSTLIVNPLGLPPPDVPSIGFDVFQFLEIIAQLQTLSGQSPKNISFKQRLNIHDITLPPAYIQKQPKVFIDGGLGSSGGTSILTSSMGLNAPSFKRNLSFSAYNSMLLENKLSLPNSLKDNLQLFLVLLLAQALVPAAQVVTDQSVNASTGSNNNINASPQTEGPIFDATAALAYSNTLLDQVTSKAIDKEVINLIANTPELVDLSRQEKESLKEVLVAIANISLLQVATSYIALSFEAPGILAQIFGNIPGAPALSDLLAPTEELQLNSVLSNPLSLFALQVALFEKLTVAEPGLSSDSAANVISAVVISIANAPSFSSLSDVQEAFAKGFEEQGLSPQASNTLAGEAIKFIKTEAELPFLDQRFIPDNLGPLLTQLPSFPPLTSPLSNAPANFPPGTVQSATLSQLLSIAQSTPAFVPALSHILNGPLPTSNREFFGLLSGALQQDNVPLAIADRLAGLTVKLLQPEPVDTEASPLLDNAQKALPITQLAENISTHVFDKLRPATNETQARNIADQTVRLLIGFNSILNALKEQFRALNELDLHPVIQAIYKDAAVVSTSPIPQSLLERSINQGFKDIIPNLIKIIHEFYTSPIGQSDLRTKNKTNLPISSRGGLDIEV